MGKKINLPLFAESSPQRSSSSPSPSPATVKRPSIDAARARLGGRIVPEADGVWPGLAPGVIVTFALASGRRLPGVIVFASLVEAHVLLDGIRLRRLKPHEVTAHDPNSGGSSSDIPIGLELTKIAGDARLFGLLVESQSVRYADDKGTLIDGKIVEKCRWGALVLRDDGAVVAVGFRKLWPVPSSTSASQ